MSRTPLIRLFGWAAAILLLRVASAETLEVKVMEIEGRLVEPTLARAFGKDRDALEDVVVKLAALGADAGVYHHASIALESKADGADARKKEVKEQELPAMKRMVTVGHDLVWNQGTGKRKLYVRTAGKEKSTPIYEFDLLHVPDGKWSLSGAVRSPRGLTVVFERVPGRPVSDEPDEWAACVLSKKKPGRAPESPPWKMVANANSPEAALVRVQTVGEGGLAGRAGVEFHYYSDVKRGFVLGHAHFTVGKGISKFVGRGVVGCSFQICTELRPDKETTWDGKGEALLEEGKALGALPVIVREDTRMADGGYRSDPQNSKNPPECHLQALRFAVKR